VKIVILHGEDATGPPPDPVLAQVAEALRARGHDASHLAIGDDVLPVIEALRAATPDLVFNLAESFQGKSALESAFAGLLNLLGMRYTGSSPSGLMLAGDKSLSKKVLGFHRVRTPEFATLYRGALDHAGDLRFPLIVKPPQEDASLGITEKSVVHDVRELLGRMDEMQQAYQQPVLVEEFIEGREFYVGVLGNAHAEALPVIELDFSGAPAGALRIASWDVKWGDAERPQDAPSPIVSVVPTDLDPDLVARMQSTAVDAFQALRLRDYARIDMRVDAAGDAYVIEVNPNCYLERKSEFAMAAAVAELGYEDLVGRIVELAAARYAR
jgi:D-alanine-D-alanine ligase